MIAVVEAIGLKVRDLFPKTDNQLTGRARPIARGTASRGSFRSRGGPSSDQATNLAPQSCTPPRVWESTSAAAINSVTPDQLIALASQLGVPAASLQALGCGWASASTLHELLGKPSREGGGFLFPMFDGDRAIIGLSVRTPSGGKFTISGGRIGLFVPRDLDATPGAVWIVEGASDTAAAHSVGQAAVGRPSNTSGGPMLAKLLKGRDVIVIGERDQKVEGGRWPGLEGARKVAAELAEAWGRDVPIALPPPGFKDVREWTNSQQKKG